MITTNLRGVASRLWATGLLAVLPCVCVAGPGLSPERMRSALEAGASLKAPATAAVYRQFFEPLCWTSEALPFDRLCNHVPPEEEDRPSPWPNAFIGLRGERIVAVVVLDARWVPRDWSCSPLPGFEGPRMCTPRGTPARTHRDWARRWGALLSSAG